MKQASALMATANVHQLCTWLGAGATQKRPKAAPTQPRGTLERDAEPPQLHGQVE